MRREEKKNLTFCWVVRDAARSRFLHPGEIPIRNPAPGYAARSRFLLLAWSTQQHLLSACAEVARKAHPFRVKYGRRGLNNSRGDQRSSEASARVNLRCSLSRRRRGAGASAHAQRLQSGGPGAPSSSRQREKRRRVGRGVAVPREAGAE
jgi:hypothetical protein